MKTNVYRIGNGNRNHKKRRTHVPYIVYSIKMSIEWRLEWTKLSTISEHVKQIFFIETAGSQVELRPLKVACTRIRRVYQLNMLECYEPRHVLWRDNMKFIQQLWQQIQQIDSSEVYNWKFIQSYDLYCLYSNGMVNVMFFARIILIQTKANV